MLQNAPLIVKIGVDTEENEPPKNCEKLWKIVKHVAEPRSAATVGIAPGRVGKERGDAVVDEDLCRWVHNFSQFS